MHSTARYSRGSIGIQLMIGVAAIFTLSTLLLPTNDDTIRSRVSKGLQQAGEAKQALALACQESKRVVYNNSDAGFLFVESMYVAEIRLSADCSTGVMDIRVRMQNTGAETDPEVLLSSGSGEAAGEASKGSWLPVWHCGLTRGEAAHVPADCRGARSLG